MLNTPADIVNWFPINLGIEMQEYLERISDMLRFYRGGRYPPRRSPPRR
jgi:hypothetical protein